MKIELTEPGTYILAITLTSPTGEAAWIEAELVVTDQGKCSVIQAIKNLFSRKSGSGKTTPWRPVPTQKALTAQVNQSLYEIFRAATDS